jgi:hypothetical protein
MQNAETVLSVLNSRGRRRLPVDELYRQLFNPALYLLAYGRVYANKGALTPGVDEQTADGMSVSVITQIIEEMRHERFRFTPVRRVHIPKKKGGSTADRWVFRRGQTNWFNKWCACCWRRTTNRSFLTSHTVSGPAEDVIPRCGRYHAAGLGRCG